MRHYSKRKKKEVRLNIEIHFSCRKCPWTARNAYAAPRPSPWWRPSSPCARQEGIQPQGHHQGISPRHSSNHRFHGRTHTPCQGLGENGGTCSALPHHGRLSHSSKQTIWLAFFHELLRATFSMMPFPAADAASFGIMSGGTTVVVFLFFSLRKN